VKGSYVLLIQLPEEQTITIGSLQARYFPGGYYAYVCSAMGGFEARIRRHLRSNKKRHWHIDYLLEKASITGVILCETNDRAECTIAQTLDHQFESVPGFGCSDCKCRSHLFFANEASQLVMVIVRIYIHGIAFAAASTSLHKIAPARVFLTGAITNDPCPHCS